MSEMTTKAMAMGKRNRKRIQRKMGKCITEDVAIERLRIEETERKEKRQKKAKDNNNKK